MLQIYGFSLSERWFESEDKIACHEPLLHDDDADKYRKCFLVCYTRTIAVIIESEHVLSRRIWRVLKVLVRETKYCMEIFWIMNFRFILVPNKIQLYSQVSFFF